MIYGFHPEALDEFDKAAATTRSVNRDYKLGLLTRSNTQFREHAMPPERFRRFDGEIRRVLVHVFLMRSSIH